MKINLSNKVNFGIKVDKEDYTSHYRKNKNYNGKEPDRFILEKLDAQSNKPKVVFDLGAGQGRNSIPIAKKGYSVFAYEINPEGQNCIKNRARYHHVADKVTIVDTNLLEDISRDSKADFAFMSHVAQHLNLEELKKIMENIYKNIRKGSEFVFDALSTEKPIDITQLPESHLLEIMGNSRFQESDLFKAAKEIGFDYIFEVPFTEIGHNRARYERHLMNPRWHEGFQLNWFVLRK